MRTVHPRYPGGRCFWIRSNSSHKEWRFAAAPEYLNRGCVVEAGLGDANHWNVIRELLEEMLPQPRFFVEMHVAVDDDRIQRLLDFADDGKQTGKLSPIELQGDIRINAFDDLL